jgi:predicted transposase YdaD
MTESVTYREILRKGLHEGRKEGRALGKAEGKAEGKSEGELKQAQRSLILFGSEVLGEPSARVRETINQLMELPVLETLTRRVAHVKNWDELLAD